MAISNGPVKRPALTLPTFPGQSVIHSPTTATVGLDGELRIHPRQPAANPQRVNPRRSEDIRDGGLSPQTGRSESTIKLPIDASDRTEKSASKVSQPVEESPAIILQGLMEKFMALKETGGKAEAFRSLQKSFAMNAAILSPYFIPLKDLMNLIMELETFIGKSGEHIGKTPEQVIRGFLSTGFIADKQISSP